MKKKKKTGKNGNPTYSLLEYEIETLTIHTKMRRLGVHNLNQQRTRKIITSSASSSTILPHLASSCQETILSPQDPKPNTDLPSSFSFLRETKPSISCPVRFSYFFRKLLRSTLFVSTVYLYVVKTEESSYRFSEQS